MMLPLVLIYERDRRLAEALRGPAEENRWLLREQRRSEQVLGLLRRRGPGVLVLQIGAAPEKDVALLQRVRDAFAETGIIAILERENPALAGIVWDLGANMVFFAPVIAESLAATVSALLRSLEPQEELSIPLAEPDVEKLP
jgi:DNA-binding response OmpR family regulator